MARDSLVPFGFGVGVGGDPLFALHREMNRVFADVLGNGGTGVGQQRGTQGTALLVPQMEVTEAPNEIRVTAEMPGVSENDIEVMLDDDLLTIRAEKKIERKEERQDLRFTERGYGVFQRSIRLPFRAKSEDVQANFENGVLTITIPKSQAQESSKRVQVQGPRAGGQSGNGQGALSSSSGTTGNGGSASTSGQKKEGGTASAGSSTGS